MPTWAWILVIVAVVVVVIGGGLFLWFRWAYGSFSTPGSSEDDS